MSTLRKLN